MSMSNVFTRTGYVATLERAGERRPRRPRPGVEALLRVSPVLRVRSRLLGWNELIRRSRSQGGAYPSKEMGLLRRSAAPHPLEARCQLHVDIHVWAVGVEVEQRLGASREIPGAPLAELRKPSQLLQQTLDLIEVIRGGVPHTSRMIAAARESNGGDHAPAAER
jgi:hypothetical protein